MSHFTVPELPYAYDALTPAISEEIMKLHHDTHHVGYVTKLNAALEEADIQLEDKGSEQATLAAALGNLAQLPASVQTAVRNNGGGHYNHARFWTWMTPGGSDCSPELMAALEARYGSFDAFKEEFSTKALGLFGSGWVWLEEDLSISTSPNQDSPLMAGRGEPLLGLDVWEHAYYLDYNAARKDYVDAWWSIVDWATVSAQFAA